MAATYEEIIAKARELAAAGDMEGAKRLGRIAISRRKETATSVAAPAQSDPRAVAALSAFEASNPMLKGKYTPETFPYVAEFSDVAAAAPPMQPDTGFDATPPRPAGPDTFGDTTAAMMSGPWDATKAFAGGLAGGPSPSREFLAQDPLTKGLPSWALTGLGGVGDTGMAALSGIGTAFSGAAGLGAEMIPFLPQEGEQDLAEGALFASQFAAPEMFGVSKASLGFGRRGAGVAAKVVPDQPVAVEATNQAVAETLGTAAKAAKSPSGKVSAKLAATAAPDAATIAAAERLGFDLPADVYATNELIRKAAGGARGVVGSADESNWIATVVKAANTADNAVRQIASGDLSTVSESVSNALNLSQQTLKRQAKALYQQVEAAIPKATPITAPKAVAFLQARAADLGGASKLSPGERSLLAQLTAKKPPTYEWVKTTRTQLGQEAFGAPDAFPNFSKAQKRMLAASMGEDMIDAAEAIGGADVKNALRAANRATAQQKGFEERIATAFGKDGYGSIATKLRTAITSGGKGDISNLNRIIGIIPEDLRKEAIGTAISALSRARGGVTKGVSDTGGFGFSEFADIYRNLKRNSAVNKTVSEAIGPDAAAVMDDLYKVSRAVTDARANVSTTGKANQWLEAVPRGITARVLESTAGQRAIQGAATGAAAMTMGPAAAGIAAPLAVMLTKSRPDIMAAAGKLFRSPEFMALVRKEAMGAGSAAELAAMQKSGPFMGFLKATGKTAADVLKSPAGVPALGQTAQPSDDFDSLYGRY